MFFEHVDTFASMGEKSLLAAHASICLAGNCSSVISRQLSDPSVIMQNATNATVEIKRNHVIVSLRDGMGDASSDQFLPI